MRYFGAVKNTKPEASFLIASHQEGRDRPVVISVAGIWYDVRALGAGEFQSFLEELARRELLGGPH